MNRRITWLLVFGMVAVSLACDPQRLPRTRKAAARATQAATQAVEEAKPVVKEITQEGKQALRRGRDAAVETYEEKVKPRLEAAGAAATRAARDIKTSATQNIEKARKAATQAVEKVRS